MDLRLAVDKIDRNALGFELDLWPGIQFPDGRRIETVGDEPLLEGLVIGTIFLCRRRCGQQRQTEEAQNPKTHPALPRSKLYHRSPPNPSCFGKRSQGSTSVVLSGT
jgi:hypothetical protein